MVSRLSLSRTSCGKDLIVSSISAAEILEGVVAFITQNPYGTAPGGVLRDPPFCCADQFLGLPGQQTASSRSQAVGGSRRHRSRQKIRGPSGALTHPTR